MVTIYDIAKKLNISASTVSRVLNNSSLIGNEISQKIIATAEELGYKKRLIRKQKSRAILNIKLVLSSHQDRSLHLFYDIAELLDGLEKGCGETRVNIAVVLESDKMNFQDHKKGGDIDGVIFAFTRPNSSVYRKLEKQNIPTLTLNRSVKNKDYITSNNQEGIKKLFYEISKKRSQVNALFVGLKPIGEIGDIRREAFEKESDNKESVILKSFHDITKLFFENLKRKKINTIIAVNDIVAIRILIQADKLGIKIPQEFSLTGFDNSPIRNIHPQLLDTISLPVYDFGLKAGNWIESKIINKSDKKFQLNLSGEYLAGETIS